MWNVLFEEFDSLLIFVLVLMSSGFQLVANLQTSIVQRTNKEIEIIRQWCCLQSRLVALADTTDVVGHLFRKELKNISTPFFLVNRCTEQVLLEKKNHENWSIGSRSHSRAWPNELGGGRGLVGGGGSSFDMRGDNEATLPNTAAEISRKKCPSIWRTGRLFIDEWLASTKWGLHPKAGGADYAPPQRWWMASLCAKFPLKKYIYIFR